MQEVFKIWNDCLCMFSKRKRVAMMMKLIKLYSNEIVGRGIFCDINVHLWDKFERNFGRVLGEMKTPHTTGIFFVLTFFFKYPIPPNDYLMIYLLGWENWMSLKQIDQLHFEMRRIEAEICNSNCSLGLVIAQQCNHVNTLNWLNCPHSITFTLKSVYATCFSVGESWGVGGNKVFLTAYTDEWSFTLNKCAFFSTVASRNSAVLPSNLQVWKDGGI